MPLLQFLSPIKVPSKVAVSTIISFSFSWLFLLMVIYNWCDIGRKETAWMVTPSKNKNNERKPEFDVICKLWNSDRRDRTKMSCFLPSFISLNVSLLFVSGGIVVGWLLCRQWWMIRNKKSIIGETVSCYYFSLDSSLHVTKYYSSWL